MKSFWLIMLSLVTAAFGSSEERPLVDAPSGKYRGHIIKARNGREVLAFQGIPYALPPVGELRFKDPVKMAKLEGTFEADKDTPLCFQPSLDFTQMKNLSTYSGTEDCLYLNLYKPKINDVNKKLPVFVWIHGGAFIMGSASQMWTGPSYFMDKDMIFVAINYRLGILGFLSTGDSVIPGNAGMKDQILALKWVQENIEAFGGDPNLVTIGGISAGGSAVSVLMHSPMSKGLFDRAIAQSGTVHTTFATKSLDKARANAKKVASYLSCSDDSEQLLKCLQKVPMTKLFEASAYIIPSYVELSMDFVPVIEEDSPDAFLTQKSLNEPSEMPIITGVTSNECTYLTTYFMLSLSKYHGNKTLLFKNTDHDIEKATSIWGGYQGHPNEKEITDAIMKYYYGKNGVEDATEIKTIDMFSDLTFNYGLRLTGRIEKGPKFIYKFSYKGQKDLSMPGAAPLEGFENGVSHGEEAKYLVYMPFLPDNALSGKDLDLSNQLIDIWYNFMKTGDPTPETKLWKKSNGGVNYLDITNHGLNMESNMFQSRMEFLDKLNKERHWYQHKDL